MFLRASEGLCGGPLSSPNPSRLRRVITAVSLTSLAVYSLQIFSSVPAEAKPPRSRKAFVRAETARLRSRPGKGSKLVGLLDAGRKAKVIGRDGSWVKVKLESGTVGWLRADLVKVSKKATRDAAAKPAKPAKSVKSASASSRKRRPAGGADEKAAAARRRKAQAVAAAKAASAAKAAAKREAMTKAKIAAAKIAAAKAVKVKRARLAAAEAKHLAALRAKRIAAARVAAAQAATARAATARKPALVSLPRPVATPAAPRPVVAAVAVSQPAPPVQAKAGNILKPAAPPAQIKPAPFKLIRAVPTVKGAPSQAAPAAPSTPAAATSGAPSLTPPAPATVPTKPVEVEAPPVHEGGEVIPEGGADATPEQLEGAIRVALATEAAKLGPGDAALDRSSSRRDRLVRRAMSYRGTPYRMGATGRGAFDCSGYVQYLFKGEGEVLPRTAAQQYKAGMPVPKDQLKAGDIVFFKNTYKRGVSHVGIFIGAGKFIHASSRGGVKVNSLSQSYYINHWAGARRPR